MNLSENKYQGNSKITTIPIPAKSILRKPNWIRIKMSNPQVIKQLKTQLRKHHLHTVCEEASCPNLNECFSIGTASFMIMGDICTRSCPFCDVAHGYPNSLDISEPINLANTIIAMQLKYVVITSVNRDDLRDGGAGHFVACLQAIRQYSPKTIVEILVPDFRGRFDIALNLFQGNLPDVFNHNLETIPRLYKQVRPGADYFWSLKILQRFKTVYAEVATKSGLMLGLGESLEEILQVMRDLRQHDCEMLTLGQYLQPSRQHLPVQRYITPAEFEQLAEQGYQMGFKNIASAPMVRSSYHADMQAQEVIMNNT
ncbi:MAG: lipoyl synthase [Thiomargarita sp.]|nr:lipoyl synthase [Thiomargarita sp.]